MLRRRAAGSRLVISIATAMAVLLGAELGVRALQGSLPETVEWYDAYTQVKVEQMDELQRQGRRVDFAFIGTSMVFRGISPEVIDAGGGSFSYNAALFGGVPPVMERWALEEVQPRVRPHVVVYGLSSVDFQGRRYEPSVRAYNDAPATRRGLMASLERIGGLTLDLVRLRALLRDPEIWKDPPESLPDETGPVEDARAELDDQGFAPKTEGVPLPKARRRVQNRVLRDYEISARGSANIARIVKSLGERGTEVVLLSMPVPQRYVDVHPNGAQDFEASQQHISDLAERLDVPLIDMAHSMPDSMFIDFTHLNEQGSERFSEKLRGRLNELGY